MAIDAALKKSILQSKDFHKNPKASAGHQKVLIKDFEELSSLIIRVNVPLIGRDFMEILGPESTRYQILPEMDQSQKEIQLTFSEEHTRFVEKELERWNRLDGLSMKKTMYIYMEDSITKEIQYTHGFKGVWFRREQTALDMTDRKPRLEIEVNGFYDILTNYDL